MNKIVFFIVLAFVLIVPASYGDGLFLVCFGFYLAAALGCFIYTLLSWQSIRLERKLDELKKSLINEISGFRDKEMTL